MKTKLKSCKCEICKGACTYKPGWFKPDEIKPLADWLNISVEKIFEDKLSVDWFYGNGFDDNVFLLAPATNRSMPGFEYPYNPKGRCVFYNDDLCEIHPVKPYECKMFIHADPRNEVQKRHEEVARLWGSHQDMIAELLGRKPYATEPESFFSSIMDLM